MRYAVAFLRFWYEFIVGDDWLVAAGIVTAIGVTAVLAGAGASSWWLMPPTVVAIMFGSLRRATRASRAVP